MNTFSTDIMTFFFVLVCCLCSFLIILIAFVFYMLGSARVRSALLAMSLIKTAVDLFKDFSRAFKAAKNVNTKSKKTAKSSTEFVDAEFRDKNN